MSLRAKLETVLKSKMPGHELSLTQRALGKEDVTADEVIEVKNLLVEFEQLGKAKRFAESRSGAVWVGTGA